MWGAASMIPLLIGSVIPVKHSPQSPNGDYIDGQIGTPQGSASYEPQRGESENVPCLLYTSPSPRDKRQSRMPSSA